MYKKKYYFAFMAMGIVGLLMSALYSVPVSTLGIVTADAVHIGNTVTRTAFAATGSTVEPVYHTS